MLVILALVISPIARADVPGLISYQGILKNSEGDPVTEAVNVTFTIYDDASASDPSNIKWQETHSVTPDANGLFIVLLGAGSPAVPITDDVFSGPDRWLGTQVESQSEMTPRTRITSYAYAQRISTVDGASGGSITGDVSIASNLNIDGDLNASGKATIGTGHTNTGTGAFVAGTGNTASGNNSTVGGGTVNNASAEVSTVGGGASNTASGYQSTVAGGYAGMASGETATIGGGWHNTANGSVATVAGGQQNTANGNFSAIGGGESNSTSSDYNTIAGGVGNSVQSIYGTICGGYHNTVINEGNSTICGGNSNSVQRRFSFIGGGSNNYTEWEWSVIGGGWGNETHGARCVVAGGDHNQAGSFDNNWATAGGGQMNLATGNFSSIAGGSLNTASGPGTTIGGGITNSASGSSATVPGGSQNSAAGDFALAAGHRAKALNTGSFVWADGTNSDFESTGDNQFLIRAAGGVGIGTNNPTSALHVNGEAKCEVGGMEFYMVPQGAIIMWSGTLASIPSGWALCDGSNGTPDLRNRFIYGVNSGEDPGGTGGSATIPAHSHTVDIAPFQCNATGFTWYGAPLAGVSQIADYRHTHTVDPPATVTNQQPATSIIPPYYRLAFIMKL